MTSFRLALIAAGGSLLAWTFARPASAQASVRLGYQAPEGCPGQVEFAAAVAARGGHFDTPEAVARARAIDVSVRKNARGFEGSLRVEANDGSSALREVHGRECMEVANGLAIVAAIALGGSTETAAPTEPAASGPAPTEAPTAPEKHALPTPAPAPPQAHEKPRLVANSFKRDDLLQVTPGTLRFDRARSYTLDAGAEFGLLPGVVLPRYDFTMSIANFVTPPATASYLVGPILQVHWSFLGPATRHSEGYSTRGYGLLAGVRSCAAFRYDTQGLVLLACGEFDVGAMKLVTRDSLGATTQAKETGFGTAGLGLDAQYDIGSWLHFDLRLGGHLQFGGVAAERPNGSELFKAPLLGGHALAGLGVHF